METITIYTYERTYPGTDITDFSVQFIADAPFAVDDDDDYISPRLSDIEGLSRNQIDVFRNGVREGKYTQRAVPLATFDFSEYGDGEVSEWLRGNYNHPDEA